MGTTLRQLWPVLVMLGLVWIAWIPYLLQAGTTERNIDGVSRQWLDAFGYSTQPIKDQNNSTFFHYVVTDANGVKVDIFRSRNETQGYVRFATALIPSGDSLKSVSGLLQPQRDALANELRIELARHQMGGFTVPNDLSRIGIETAVPINGLTEFEFISTLNSVRLASLAVREILRRR